MFYAVFQPLSCQGDRLLYYGCSLIHRQIERGDKKYFLKPVYVLCIADYLRRHIPEVPEDKILAAQKSVE